jgi:hypothetical protein
MIQESFITFAIPHDDDEANEEEVDEAVKIFLRESEETAPGETDEDEDDFEEIDEDEDENDDDEGEDEKQVSGPAE